MKWEKLKYSILVIICSLLTLICLICLTFADQNEKKLMSIESKYEEKALDFCKNKLQKVSTELHLACLCYGEKNYKAQLDELVILCESIKSVCSLYEFENSDAIQKHTNELLQSIKALPRELSPTSRSKCERMRLQNESFLKEL